MAGYVVFRTSNSVHGGLYRCSGCIGFVTPFFLRLTKCLFQSLGSAQRQSLLTMTNIHVSRVCNGLRSHRLLKLCFPALQPCHFPAREALSTVFWCPFLNKLCNLLKTTRFKNTVIRTYLCLLSKWHTKQATEFCFAHSTSLVVSFRRLL